MQVHYLKKTQKSVPLTEGLINILWKCSMYYKLLAILVTVGMISSPQAFALEVDENGFFLVRTELWPNRTPHTDIRIPKAPMMCRRDRGLIRQAQIWWRLYHQTSKYINDTTSWIENVKISINADTNGLVA